MATSKSKQFFLVPNFILRKIEPGDIITDPYNPQTVLSTASEGNFPPLPEPRTITISNYKLNVSEESARNFEIQLSSTLLGLGAGVGGDLSKYSDSYYEIEELETVFYDSLKLEDVMSRVVQDERVWTILKGRSWFRRRKPVFIVTGVKIARDMRVGTSVAGSDKGESKKKAAVKEEFCIRGEVVIAYRISKIETRSGKEQGLKMDQFTSSAAFM